MTQVDTTLARSRSLDDWYRTVNRIYLDQNFYRDTNSVFVHLVEVVGGLSLLGTGKDKPGVDPRSFLPKAVAWWLALCGKMGIRSVEDMLWAKFPYACPYCQKCPHENDPCKESKREGHGADWGTLSDIGRSNERKRPRTLAQWQCMFYDIYKTPNDPTYSTPILRFTEELGELAESVRIAAVAPGYFLSEASDVFAWLMNVQNVDHSRRNLSTRERGFGLSDAFARAYPDGCRDCGGPVCTCPPILVSSLGRIAREVPADASDLMTGKPLMTTDEARELFELGAREIRVGSKTLGADSLLIRGIHETVAEMRVFLVGNEEMSRLRAVDLARALAAVEKLTVSQRITQESVDKVQQAIAALPSEGRSAVVDFLSGVSSSVWATALIETISRVAK